MDKRTAALLRSIAELIAHAQAHPTDTVGLGKKRKARASAEHAWLAAGSPDLPSDAPKPTVIPRATREPEPDSDGKDWTPVRLLLEVITLTDGGAAKCFDGTRLGYAPQKLLWEPGTREPVPNLREDTTIEVDIPAWLAYEKGWR
jgi:hypothetical protein